jgi:acetyl esterase/lipase
VRTGPPIDPELLPYLPAEESDRPFMDGPVGITTLRDAMAALYEDVDEVRARTGAVIEETVVAGVPVIVARPDAPGRRPGLLAVHGGGLVAGGHRSGLESNVRLALELDAAIVIPDYRLAPEHPYPAPLDDVTAVWEWLAAGGADAVGAEVDTARLVVLGGSSGGGLAAGLLLRILEGFGAQPAALVLVQPQLDDRNAHPSTFELENEAFWDRASNAAGWAAYLGDLVGDVPSDAAPARATELAGFPPTFVEIAQVDLFRDEELDFVARLSRAGVPVEAHLWAGAFHGFDGLAATRVARRAIATRTEFLRGVLTA